MTRFVSRCISPGPIRRALLTPWKNWFQSYPRLQTPAWINVSTNNVSPWFMTGGLLAVRDLTMGETPEDPQLRSG
jgi:endoglucanase